MRMVKFLIAEGMDPQKLLLKRNRTVKFAKFLIIVGIDPVRLFIDKSSWLRDFSIPISWGIVPESPLLLSKSG